MIKIIRIEPLEGKRLRLYFSDASHGDYDLQPLIAQHTELVQPLNNDDYFKRCYLELGALCWPNGLELSPANIHRKLAERQLLRYEEKVA
ncbi:DUF2442 domain-containing protein [Methylomonas koyamae]|uniref:DUF2442 domain-containing protein n=1 Tax=Methylomonas koyamae TaxID=702114 RepID=UPI0006D17551|nr:DUF2442 domain-containing protein [Methylomonas koyamae]BBL56819.1 hypothetical protein MKFW12EY_04320 [Methylomonas koyamae]